MLKKTNFMEIFKNIAEGNVKITDNSINGKCSKCGECCSCFLPICQEELELIQNYVIKNNIKPQTHILVMQNRLACPYYNGKKCLIYEVRPLICKEFYCNGKINYKNAENFIHKKYITVNMWEIAKEIENQRKSLKKYIKQ